jgi:hypothetical protein
MARLVRATSPGIVLVQVARTSRAMTLRGRRVRHTGRWYYNATGLPGDYREHDLWWGAGASRWTGSLKRRLKQTPSGEMAPP